jgi:hypothetical protein
MIYFGLANLLFLLRYALASMQGARRQIYYFVILGLFLFSAFRFQVGCDWSGYYYQYERAANFELSLITNSREPIWWAFLAWFQTMKLPYPIVNIFSSAVFFVGIHLLARRQPDPLGFLVLLFPILIINLPMSGIRQGAAIGLVCIAFTAFIDRRPFLYAFWLVVAAGFHASALVLMLLLPLATGSFSKLRLVMAGLFAIPGAILLADLESAEIASSRYIGTDVEAFGAIFRVGILFLSSLYFLIFIRKKWMQTFPHDYNIVYIGAICMSLAILVIPVSSVIGDRFGYYLIPIQAMIFARIPYLSFRSNKALHSALPYMLLLLVFGVWTQLSGNFNQCYVPYDSWIFGFPSGDLLR